MSTAVRRARAERPQVSKLRKGVEMLLIRSASELLDAFRPLDLRIFELPDEATFPLLVRGYRAWEETGGAKVYLVYEDPGTGRARGVVFRRNESVARAAVSQMCDWCHTIGSAYDIALLTADESARRRVGIHVCRDLRCRERIEEAGDLAGRDTAAAKKRLLERIARFAREALNIGATAAER